MMMQTILAIVLVHLGNANAAIFYEQSKWTISTLPRNMRQAAVGYTSQNNTIYLLGGESYDYDKKLTSFDPITQTFTDTANSYFTQSIFGYAQYYTQIDEYLYLLTSGSTITRFNVDTASISNPSFSSAPYAFDYYAACLATLNHKNNDYFFVLGTGKYNTRSPWITNKVQIFNASDNSWITEDDGVPQMTKPRTDHACISYQNTVIYVIGGYSCPIVGTVNSGCGNVLDVEVLNAADSLNDLSNTANIEWTLLNDQLSSIASGRAFLYSNYILRTSQQIDVIDPTTNTISNLGYLYSSQTNWVYGTAPAIIVDDILYVFYTADYGYYDLSATAKPTIQPTIHPTLPDFLYDDWTIVGEEKDTDYFGEPFSSTLYTGFPAVGTDRYKDYIYILGGIGDNSDNKYKKITQYSISSNVFDSSQYVRFSIPVYSKSQNYVQAGAQMGWQIYMLSAEYDESRIVQFSGSTWEQSQSTTNFADAPYNFDGSATCLALMTVGADYYFFVIGRGDSSTIQSSLSESNMVQILNVTNNSWLNHSIVPNINKARSNMACITHENSQLYVIGGQKDSTYYHDSLEVLDVASLFKDGFDGNTVWMELSDTLSEPMYSGRALAYYHQVLYLGAIGQIEIKDIYVIDTKTNTVSIDGGYWGDDMWQYAPAAIIVNTRLYVFGCYRKSSIDYGLRWKIMDLPQPPTYQPTLSPSSSPTIPTISPTASPIPTKPPSAPPTNAPSSSPSFLPSNAPSFTPSLAPSFTPSLAPTRFPTITDPYDSYFNIVYGLQSLIFSNMLTITNDAVHVINDMERMIERGYVDQDEIRIGYKQFQCKISKLNDYKIKDIDYSSDIDYKSLLYLTSYIECNAAGCDRIISNNDDILFTKRVTQQLRDYFVSETVEFMVISASDEILSLRASSVVMDSDDLSSINYGFYASLSIALFFMMIGLIAYCYNDGVCFIFPRIPGCTTVDDGNYIAVILFALHFYDFSSDVNLSIDIWFNNAVSMDNILLLICAIGSTVFVAVPYIINLYYAATIKHRIVYNEFAETWFNNYATLFTSMVIFSGGCYPSLEFASSHIFGLSMLSSSLTPYELKQMIKIRIFSNLLFENVPQIIIQLLYSFIMKQMDAAVIFAFISSSLSVVCTVLQYFIDRDAPNTKVVKYYLITQKEDNTQIDKHERLNININKGRRYHLAKSMAQVFGIPHSNIQIGGTIITKYGFIMLIIHFVHETDIDSSTPTQSFIDQLYASFKTQTNNAFRDHFKLTDNFHVNCQHSLSIETRAIHEEQKEGYNPKTTDMEIVDTMYHMGTK